MPQGPSQFLTTRWTLVVEARGADAPRAKAALEELCRRYWLPIYAFVRRRGHSEADAQDLTQSFLTELLERKSFGRADEARGRLRSFLLGALTKFLASGRARAGAQKRGGGAVVLSLDFEAAEAAYRIEPSHEETPERIFERNWGLTLLDRVFETLREEHRANGRVERFEALAAFVTGTADPGEVMRVAGELGLTESAVRVAIHRLRHRYRQLLRAEVASTVADPSDVDGELTQLLDSF